MASYAKGNGVVNSPHRGESEMGQSRDEVIIFRKMSGDIMEFWDAILLWIHFAAIGVGGAASFGLPVVGAVMAGAQIEARPALAGVAGKLSILGRSAIGVLIVTGVLMVLAGPGLGGVNLWFWIKMSFVVLLIAGVVAGVRAGRQAREGNQTALQRTPLIGKINIGLFLAIVASAVLSFG